MSDLEEDLLGQSSKIDIISGKVDGIEASKMYRVDVVTEGVNIFRDKGQSSIMRCKVYSWDQEITSTLDASAFAWHRHSSSAAADAEWDAAHVGMKQVTITTEDVSDNASFYCEVTI